MPVTLLALDPALVASSWRDTPVADLLAARPRGRLAAVLAGPPGPVGESAAAATIDPGRPAYGAFASAPPATRRAVFEALAEDLAWSTLHDVPGDTLNTVWSALKRAAGTRLDGLAPELAAGPAYPADLLEPGVESSGPSLAAWDIGARGVAAALSVAPDVLEASSLDPLGRDVLGGLVRILGDAARPEAAVWILKS